MTDKTKIKAIKTVCWIGVFADGLWAVALVSPPLYGMLTGRSDLSPDLNFRLAMGIGASLMFGWTVLLAWCARNPLERRAVMLFTAFPVIFGLSIVTLIGFGSGTTANLWILGKLVFICAGMIAAYGLANRMTKENAHEIEH